MASSLRSSTTTLASALRPAAGRRAQQNLPRVARRYKSGPYGYTQAKALVFSKEGEPSDVLQYDHPIHSHFLTSRNRTGGEGGEKDEFGRLIWSKAVPLDSSTRFRR
ncbi:hypothetical protein CH063_04731 [Colletotrichum higginsianum]|uniref:Uncharacterized protein n=1 Tax=Colletotrichum higginsianum (strain IMI 349063) TaxID=759273 RepID=H1UWG9_COLHI|nr:hypothetical protein CH063_04731 [Colletotrichum higginsianum]